MSVTTLKKHLNTAFKLHQKMEKILVFDTYEHAYKRLHEYEEKNNLAIDELDKRIIATEDEYLSRLEVKERKLKEWKENNEKRKKAGLTTFAPETLEFALEAFSLEEIESIRKDLGNGLEIIAGIALQLHDKKYSIDLSVRSEGHEVHALYDSDCKSIVDLVSNTQEAIAETKKSYYGAIIKPLFYTVTDEKSESFFPEGEKPRKIILDNPRTKKFLKELSFSQRLIYKLLIHLGVRANVPPHPMHGLNQVEREQFEKVYFGLKD